MSSIEKLSPSDKKPKVFDHCPHCGVKLSRWEQVLLNVDRAIMCKNCWYRIIFDVFDEGEEDKGIKK